jgi:organic radical activating enzyme
LENRARSVLISPVFGVENLPEIAETVSKSGLKVRLNLQLHKYIWGADRSRSLRQKAKFK